MGEYENMTRQKTGSIIAGIAAMAFLGTAVLHSTGFDSISQLSEQAPTDLRAVAPALWLTFSFDLSVLGLIVAIIAFRPNIPRRLVMVVASLCPSKCCSFTIMVPGIHSADSDFAVRRRIDVNCCRSAATNNSRLIPKEIGVLAIRKRPPYDYDDLEQILSELQY